MVSIGNLFSPSGKKALLLGAGELGKEIAIELIRYGIEVVAIDRYEHAPAMHVAQRNYVLSMLNAERLKAILLEEKPDYIIPEVEAIATEVLLELEEVGFNIIPNAQAVITTMNREEIRRLAVEECGITTSDYAFASSLDELKSAVSQIGFPCVVKPIMSSSGRGQSVLKHKNEIEQAWKEACEGGRGRKNRVIIEGFVDFDFEISLLTVRARNGTQVLEPIGHTQISGDYRTSWQPQEMNPIAYQKAKQIATKVCEALGGYGLYGVELFIKGEDVFFNEVSPRPHDTGMVTMISQDLSEFALHTRAILGLPIPKIQLISPSASKAIVLEGESSEFIIENIDEALSEVGVEIRLFAKPNISGHRRVAVLLAKDESTSLALEKVDRAYNKLNFTLH